MTAFDLRAARPTDAGRVGAILSAFIDGTDWMPRIHTRAEDLSFAGYMIDKGWVTVATHAGHVQGFVSRHMETIHALYVAPDFRGQGCGTALLCQMQRDSAQLGLWTFQANLGAQKFYVRHGFEEAERTDGSGNDEGLPDIRYTWTRGTA